MNEYKILIVDDDEEDQCIIQEALELLNTDNIVNYVFNGEQALSLLDQGFTSGIRPRLIVLDLNMPRMNGTETLGKLKADQRYRDIPVIIYSTSINPFEKKKCIELGAQAYITKPISVEESIHTAKTFLLFCQ